MPVTKMPSENCTIQTTHLYRNLDTQTSREINKFTFINLHS